MIDEHGSHAAGGGSIRFDLESVDRASRSDVAVDATGRIALSRGDAAVRQSLLMLLSTVPGERVMRPEYGCPLHRLVFQPLDNTTAGQAIDLVERSVRRFESRVEVLRIDASPSPDRSGALAIELRYRVRRSLTDGHVGLEIDLDGGAVS